MPRLSPNVPRSAILVAICVVVSSTMPGCARGRKQAVVPQNALGAPVGLTDRPIAIDVNNMMGSVSVDANDRYETLSVEWRVHKGDKAEALAGHNSDEAHEWISTVYRLDGQHEVVTVTSNPPPMESGEFPRVSLVIKTPRCDGVRIRNAGGSVHADGIDGAITIENGRAGVPGDRVQVRTAHPIEDPVSITSTRGPVHLIAAPGSKGVVSIESGENRAIFSSSHGRVLGIEKPTSSAWKGQWNGGTQPITLVSGNMDAALLVVERPEGYTVGRNPFK